MDNRVLVTPLNYLRLVDYRRVRLIYQNITAHLVLFILFSAPFLIFEKANFFHKDGFIDKLGSFSSVLTGFYVAGLLAVATFGEHGTNDKPITVGPIILPKRRHHLLGWRRNANPSGGESEFEDDDLADDQHLSRREYVCYMFGYLAFASLVITIFSIVVVSVLSAGSQIRPLHHQLGAYRLTVKPDFFRGMMVIAVSAYLSHVIITTCRALYYLTDRLYAKEPELLPRTDDEGNH
ncbi:hypothetical protein QE363_001941 [Sphingomonas sp. SORGH_AS870]|uniref:hypothetical protein n=1 Tax=Sphingomonas sp. SORGH_AS_0870 TaxID=3041801 RepID=UPI002862B61A|nr:hypothetical protein [Sphingomonas sp. SORGH_AS_0870]MDR6146148.1 hypothetical protein [Sphingomonas sp. SORGH_AS_0870]